MYTVYGALRVCFSFAWHGLVLAAGRRKRVLVQHDGAVDGHDEHDCRAAAHGQPEWPSGAGQGVGIFGV